MYFIIYWVLKQLHERFMGRTVEPPDKYNHKIIRYHTKVSSFLWWWWLMMMITKSLKSIIARVFIKFLLWVWWEPCSMIPKVPFKKVWRRITEKRGIGVSWYVQYFKLDITCTCDVELKVLHVPWYPDATFFSYPSSNFFERHFRYHATRLSSNSE